MYSHQPYHDIYKWSVINVEKGSFPRVPLPWVPFLFIVKKWFSLFALLNTDLSRQFCSELTENRWKHFLIKIFCKVVKVAENSFLWSIAFLAIERFRLTPLCWYLIFNVLAFRFFIKAKFLLISRICYRSKKFLTTLLSGIFAGRKFRGFAIFLPNLEI